MAAIKALESFALQNMSKIMIIELKIPIYSSNTQNDTGGSNQDTSSNVVSVVLDKLFSLCPQKTKIVLVNSQVLTKNSQMDKILEVSSLNQNSRYKMLAFILQSFDHDLSLEQIMDITMRTAGFSIFDLMKLCKSAYFEQYKQDPKSVVLVYSTLKSTILKTKPINLNKLVANLDSSTTQLSFDSIGGYDHIKSLLQNQFLKPLTNPEIYINRGLKPPSGLLLFGPPGCSKTLFAKALASTSYFNFISVKGPEIFSKYVGDSEKTIRDIFTKARINAPCVVFFDEIDAVGGRRGSEGSGGSSGVGERVLLQLLTEMDGFSEGQSIQPPKKDFNKEEESMQENDQEIGDKKSKGKGDLSSNRVVVIGATNRPESLDDALIRPGRLDTMAYIGLPDSGARKDIFDIQKKSMNWEMSDEEMQQAVDLTNGYTGAEIVQICQKAGFLSIERDEKDYFIRWEDLLKSIKDSKPRITSIMIEKYRIFESSRK